LLDYAYPEIYSDSLEPSNLSLFASIDHHIQRQASNTSPYLDGEIELKIELSIYSVIA
jgi:hypothetical protein